MTRKKQTPVAVSATTTTKTVRATREKKVSSSESGENNRYVGINEIVPTKLRLKCKNVKQKDFLKLIDDKDIVFAYGPAGTGKSYTAIAKGIELLQTYPEKYTTLKIVKPAVEVEESYGFLPGTLKEKMEPILASSMDIIDKLISRAHRISLENANVITVEPLGFLRGKTLDNTILIVEEAQNMSTKQMKTLLTRIGDNSKFIISGDLDQSDKYDDVRKSGLYDSIKRFNNLPEIGMLEFLDADIVRNPLIIKILKEYAKDLTGVVKDRVIITPTPKSNLNEITKPKETSKPNWFKKNFSW